MKGSEGVVYEVKEEGNNKSKPKIVHRNMLMSISDNFTFNEEEKKESKQKKQKEKEKKEKEKEKKEKEKKKEEKGKVKEKKEK